ncbi:gp25 [Clostridium sp. CAG:356]|nr:gp25 [Clostridium sp. CAG:356]
MSANTDLIYNVKRKMLAKYPRFGSEIAVANIEFKDNLKYHTAATDGKNIYVDPNYFASLSENDRLFTIAHEIMHIKFMHMFRLKDKSGVKRDPELWNIATDAIINANLERDGFTIKEGYVNMPEALDYSAEEFYQKLLQEKEKKEQEQEDEQNSNNENSEQTENQESDNNKSQGDDHSLWKEAFKEQQNSGKKGQRQDKNTQKQAQKQTQEQDQEQEEEQIDTDFDERGEFEDNRKEKREKFKSRREKTEKDIRNTDKGTIELGDIGKSKEEIDWKLLIRKEIEKSETIWSQRRSIAENNYAYRLEENDIEDDAETEVMIDVSGSVDLELVKSFLRQLKPLLQQSKLRVGCFNEQFWGMVDIKNVREIDNFTIPRGARGHSAWTEDWDLAVRSFTKKREINKIVFTDGYPCPGTMPKEDLKRENIIWLVYGNKDFKPCCGKVINVTEKQLEQLHQIDKSSSMEDISR